MFKFFSTQPLSHKHLASLVQEINKLFESVQLLNNDELREKTKLLAAQIADELSEFDFQIDKLRHQLKADQELDVVALENIYNRIEELENQKYDKSEQVLQQHIPLGFALFKSTCARFAASDQVVVQANNYDTLLSEYRPFLTLTNDQAVYKTSWIAGGKQIDWNMVPYDTQLKTGIVLQYGEIAEMQNGEGKTLAAAISLFLNGIASRHVHVCTANPFLSMRDCEWMRPLFEFHGIFVGCLSYNNMDNEERMANYRANIVYGTTADFGFDYLNDNLAISKDAILQKRLDVVIIDEIDAILIDDARSPLSVSGAIDLEDKVVEQYRILAPVIHELVVTQQELLQGHFEKATQAFAAGQSDTACWHLSVVKLGNPTFPNFHHYVNSTPQLLYKLNAYQKNIERDNIGESIEKALYYTISTNNEIEITAIGKAYICKLLDEPEFWTLPDTEMEWSAIEASGLDIMSQIARKNNIFESYNFLLRRHHILNQLLHAYTTIIKDRDYIVKDDYVYLIDSNTGRIMPSKNYSDGLHQAVQQKEGVELSEFTEILGTISYQTFFPKYRKMTGMTATAKLDETEYNNIYGKRIIEIPPYKPTLRKDHQDLVYRSKREKYNAVVDEIIRINQLGRPILVGTTSIEDSELLSTLLLAKNVQHQVLNAKQDAEEAFIISEAGLPGRITIAAMMAGRGTDIKLTAESRALGGLAVIGLERHDNRRLDHQLSGRAGRQGDPGSSHFFVSLEDELMRKFGSDRIVKLMEKMGIEEGEEMQSPIISSSILRSQKKIESYGYSSRVRLYEYDNTLNLARENLYQKRNHALQGYRVALDVRIMFDSVSYNVIKASEKNYDIFTTLVFDAFDYATGITAEEFHRLSTKELTVMLYTEAYDAYSSNIAEIASSSFLVYDQVYQERSETIEKIIVPFAGKLFSLEITANLLEAVETRGKNPVRQYESAVILSSIDKHWKAFLKRYNIIKEDISMISSIGKGDPLLLFKKDISEYYAELLTDIYYDAVKELSAVQIPQKTESEEVAEEEGVPGEEGVLEGEENVSEDDVVFEVEEIAEEESVPGEEEIFERQEVVEREESILEGGNISEEENRSGKEEVVEGEDGVLKGEENAKDVIPAQQEKVTQQVDTVISAQKNESNKEV